MLARFREGSIRWQIVSLAVLPILLVGALGIVTEPLFPDDIELSPAEVLAAKIDLLVDQLQHASSAQAAEAVIEATQKSGLDVRLEDPVGTDARGDFGTGGRLRFILNEIQNSEAGAGLPEDGVQRIVVQAAGRQLSIALPAEVSAEVLSDEVVSILLYMLLITAPVLLLSLLQHT